MGILLKSMVENYCAKLEIVLFLKIPFLIFSLLFGFSSLSYGGNLTLSEYLSQVKKVNPTLRASVLRVEALNHRVSPAGTIDDPFIA